MDGPQLQQGGIVSFADRAFGLVNGGAVTVPGLRRFR